jgi:hypothetical protein
MGREDESTIWRSYRFAYDASSNLIYLGSNRRHDANTSDNDWIVAKLSYDASDNLETMRKRITSWDNRAVGW